jgi:hypothetical protein
VARRTQRCATEQHEMRAPFRRHDDLVARPQHQQPVGGKDVAGDSHLAVEHVDRPFLGLGGNAYARAGGEPQIGVKRVGGRVHGRGQAVEAADDDTAGEPLGVDHRQVGLRRVFKHRRDLLAILGQGKPGLQARYGVVAAAGFLRRALGMDNAAAGRHQVHVAGFDHHLGAERIAVANGAVEQIGHRRQPDMGMRPDVERLAGAQDRRAHAVEEDERADQPPARGRQGAANLEAADVAGVRHDHQFDRVAAGRITGTGIVSGKEAHGASRGAGKAIIDPC